MKAHRHKWRRTSTTFEDVGRGLKVTTGWTCSTCHGERTSETRIRPPAATAKAQDPDRQIGPAAPGRNVPDDGATEALAALGYRRSEAAAMLFGTTGTREQRIAAALAGLEHTR